MILAVNELPDLLKKQLEIGKLEVEDIPNDNKNSIYVQIKSLLKSDDSYIIFSRLIDVLPAKDIISTERILKMCVDSVKSEKAKNPRKVLMILKKEEVIKKLNISRDFTQKLVLCALESYKYLAVEKNRYDFIGSLLEIGGNICEKKNIRLDENYMVEKWKELKHPWFVEAYLKTRFKVLNFESMRIEYPWLSLLEWDASTVNISTYSEVVMVLTAWIRCDENVGCILDCVEKILPKDIDRQELLDKMVSKIDGLEISDGRKDEIREECDAAIHKIKSEAAISILELTMDKIQISNSKQEEVTPIEPASEDDKENEIVELPENKDDCLLHLDKEYWEKLTINQQLFIKNYREEVHRMDN
ncbi:unnamed protein product [Caenorhabditis angaria]|uniref:Uncharacterized protein n=1 Tax=Caenorhabditis angaria TaxID=860376 RepID=A0A9P1MT07_9PELO|nr:unnamed protein product [Caenorhabditis angaria]